ncbi:MAG TPA: hypothetical protein VGU25_06810 [Acidobacteriaceae bacterium]|nr:hypothetical protein [Acidobacteriaceae bacterium]
MILANYKRLLFAFIAALLFASSAYAHVGNKDIYQTVTVGPYNLFITIRTPLVIPGVAIIEVRSSGAPVSTLTITPLPLTGEASKHPPTPDAMKVSSSDRQFFTGSLWIMESGSWQIRFGIDGAAGNATASVPVPAVARGVLRMQRPLGLMLGLLGCILVLGIVGIVMAAAREARLVPGATPNSARRRLALIAGAAAFIICVAIIYLGGKWWNVEAADYAADIHHNSELRATLTGNQLALLIGDPDPQPDGPWKPVKNSNLLTDHGHLMHLYAIRWPQMDAVFHLHPVPTGKSGFTDPLPAMPPGTYHLYADVVFPNGFPETETANLTVPAGMPASPLGSEDASATPPPLSSGELGPACKLPDGYTMAWDKPATLSANTPYDLVFHLLDPQGRPATDMQPYLGMAGHAAFVKTDGTAFAHTHPEGSAAMPAVMLANESDSMAGMPDTMNMAAEAISSTVAFPYGFPSAGPYRIFIQMKHGNTVETGVFDASVH